MRDPSRHSAGQARAATGGAGVDSDADVAPDTNAYPSAHPGFTQRNASHRRCRDQCPEEREGPVHGGRLRQLVWSGISEPQRRQWTAL